MKSKTMWALSVVLLLALVSMSAHAGERRTTHIDIGQGQEQGQGQTQGQTSTNTQRQITRSTSGAGAESNNSVNIDGDRVNIDPPAYAPSLGSPASGPCTGASGGLSGGGLGLFALGINGSTLDDECTRRENARVLALLGDQATALELMYQNPDVARARSAVQKQGVSRQDIPCQSALSNSGAESSLYQRCIQTAIRNGQPFMTQGGVVTPALYRQLMVQQHQEPPQVIVQVSERVQVVRECNHYPDGPLGLYRAC